MKGLVFCTPLMKGEVIRQGPCIKNLINILRIFMQGL